MEPTNGLPTSIWDVPPDVRVNVGGRHVLVLLAVVGIGTLVGVLGTFSFPLGDVPSGFAPGAAVQVVSGIWFGVWGVLGGVLFPLWVRWLTDADSSAGHVVADLIISGMAAAWFRRFRVDPRMFFRRDRLAFIAVGVIASNLLAAVVGASYAKFVDGQHGRWLAHVGASFSSGAGACLVFGLPLLRTLSPVVVRSSLFCRDGWRSPAELGTSMRRFRHQPILVKILLGLGAAGFLPLLIVVLANLWDDYRQAQAEVIESQRALADQIDGDLRQMFVSDEELLINYAQRLPALPLPGTAPGDLADTSPFSTLWPPLVVELSHSPLGVLIETDEIDVTQQAILRRGETLATIGLGRPPELEQSLKLIRLIPDGPNAGTVVVASVRVSAIEKTLFAAARTRRNEYGLFTDTGQSILASADYRRPTQAEIEGHFTDSDHGVTRLYHRHVLQPPGWRLELMIPQVFGIRDVLARQRNFTAVVTTFALFAALVIGGYLARALERPIRELTRTVRQAGQIDVAVEARVFGHDEIGELAATFNEMSRHLRRSIAALQRTTAEKERLSYEIELAAQLQRRILPAEAPRLAGFEIAGLCVQAREVGGDFYDWHPLSDIRLGLLIGDACGKGLAAAFLVNEARSIALAHFQDTASAGAVLRRTNYTMVAACNLQDAFTTMFCAILTVPSGRLAFACAGHPAPIWYRPAADELTALDTDGRPLGLEIENPIGDAEAVLTPGDVVVAFTDGVLDATNPTGEGFGRARLEQLVREHHHLSADALAKLVEQRIQQFCESVPQVDDLTVLVIRCTTRDEPTADVAPAAGVTSPLQNREPPASVQRSSGG